MSDLFQSPPDGSAEGYSAKDIEVLEGLEPVRRRPGMYIGGTDEKALHHLVAEVLDNSMDEAVAGHASLIDVTLGVDNEVTIRDNGRGIPVDPHPRQPDKSALEVILTTLHAGGKFSGKAYQTSGGLHGVGVSVVNALSDRLLVEVARDKTLYAQSYSRGVPLEPLKKIGNAPNRRGTVVTFHPDAEIFGAKAKFRPSLIYRLARSKAYLYRGVKIRWNCDPSLLVGSEESTPQSAELHFPDGLADFLAEATEGREMLTSAPFAGRATFPDDQGRAEWAVAWAEYGDGFFNSYCNTIPTPEGGTHAQGIRAALSKGLRSYGEMRGVKKAAQITPDDVLQSACVMLSAFIRDPQFQGQTKEKLATAEATRLVENALRDHFDHWLSENPERADGLLSAIILRAEERLKRRQAKELARKTATKKLRLPGKLADCSSASTEGTELFIVEGDSAGGSAKQARDRKTQAILPLRGKILNVASATPEKMRANQEIRDLIEALGCGTGEDCDPDRLRYERIIIMTDADVDGAHIASLLMTFFFCEMPQIVETGRVYLAMPPLYRLAQGRNTAYAMDDPHREELMATVFTGRGKVEVSRFKGLGEMPPAQLKETTMDPTNRTLLRVTLPRLEEGGIAASKLATADLVDRLMGKKPEARFQFIQENAKFAADIDI